MKVRLIRRKWPIIKITPNKYNSLKWSLSVFLSRTIICFFLPLYGASELMLYGCVTQALARDQREGLRDPVCVPLIHASAAPVTWEEAAFFRGH